MITNHNVEYLRIRGMHLSSKLHENLSQAAIGFFSMYHANPAGVDKTCAPEFSFSVWFYLCFGTGVCFHKSGLEPSAATTLKPAVTTTSSPFSIRSRKDRL